MEKQTIYPVGQKVKIVGDPKMPIRFEAFAFLLGTETEIIDIAWKDDKTVVHQYGVKFGKSGAYFFPSELEKIS